MSDLFRAAAALLRANDRGRYTVPSPHLYPHQWAWDSGFAAIGWLYLDRERAVVELETLLAGAWADGRVPHIFFHDTSGTYFPGPDFWETTESTSITQPPNWAIAARRLVEGGADRDRIRALLPAIDASHRFFAAQRDPDGMGAVVVVHPWESGLDNSPAWDSPMQAIDPTRAPAFRRVDVERVDDPGERPSDEEYKRYAVIVKAIAADGFGPGPFAVYDPFMTAMLARAEADLAWLSDELGVETAAAARAHRLREGLAGLFDADRGYYRFRDAAAGSDLYPDILAAHVPIMVDEAPGREVAIARLRARYMTRFPLPTAAPDSPAFDPRCYWRGPTWLSTNWLLSEALPEIVEPTLELVDRAGFREYYHPHEGAGLGATDFTWTAALVLDWLAQKPTKLS